MSASGVTGLTGLRKWRSAGLVATFARKGAGMECVTCDELNVEVDWAERYGSSDDLEDLLDVFNQHAFEEHPAVWATLFDEPGIGAVVA